MWGIALKNEMRAGSSERTFSGDTGVRAGQWREKDKLKALLKDAEANRSLTGLGDRRNA